MAWNLCNIDTSGGGDPIYYSQANASNTFSSSGTGSATATPQVKIQELGKYLIYFCASQSSSNSYIGNSSMSVGNWSIDSGAGNLTQLSSTGTLARSTSTGQTYHGGGLREYSDVTLVEVTELSDGKEEFKLSRSATCGGYGGNVIAAITVIKLS